MADRVVPVVEKRLMDVKLGELGTWLGGRDFSPKGFLSAYRSGNERFHNKYVHVNKGGFGCLAMYMTGLMVISYIWSFDHIKHERLRKYH